MMKRKLKNRSRRQGIKMTRSRPGLSRFKNEVLEDAQILIVPNDGSEPIVVDADVLAEIADADLPEITDPENPDPVHVMEIILHGDIGCDWNTSQAVAEQLQYGADDADPILVSINSDGGDLFEAVGIYNALLRREGPVTVRVDGRACSAASLIAMAGDTVIMPENSMMMIHQVFNEMFGDAEELREAADMMDAMSDSVVSAYVEKSGLSEDEVLAMMEAETWLSAEEAVSLGFADEIETPIRMTMMGHSKLFAKFRNTPPRMRSRKAGASRQRSENPKAKSRISVKNARHQQAGVRPQITASKNSNVSAISGLCRAAGVPHLVNEYVGSGMSLADVRKSLLEARRSGVGTVNTRLRVGTEKSLNSGDVYAKRQVSAKK